MARRLALALALLGAATACLALTDAESLSGDSRELSGERDRQVLGDLAAPASCRPSTREF